MQRDLNLSVIVPVWNGADEIGAFLDAISRQTAPGDAYEVIVVDNGSTDGTGEIVERHPSVRLLREKQPGSYAARNHAIENSRGRFLLFTDADCVPAPDWVATALRLVEDHGEDCLIGGRVDLFRVGKTGSHSVRYEELTAFQQETNLANGKCVTANWLCSHRLLDDVGRFDASMMSGGDVECAGRIAAAGYAFVYAPDLVVGHPTRATLSELLRKRRRVVGGRWHKLGETRDFGSFSKQLLLEHVGQARWMRKSSPNASGQIGILFVLGSLWVTSQTELVRLRLGGRPSRS